MTPPILIRPPAIEMKVNSLAELLKQQKIRAYQVCELLSLNKRTAKQRIQEPEGLTVAQLLRLAEMLNVPEHQLLDLIQHEKSQRPTTPAAPAPAPKATPVAPATKPPRKPAKPAK